MCRLLGYLGPPVGLDELLYDPEHSLVVQSYQPREMEALMNADGFGLGWYACARSSDPFRYRNTAPIWSDLNLPHLSRYVESSCILGYVRSATPGFSVDFSYCQPFSSENLSVGHRLLFTHNGYINRFRQTLYRPIRNALSDEIYQAIQGTTDSEHLFALILNQLQTVAGISLQQALVNALAQLGEMARAFGVYFCANVLLADGQQLIAARCASESPAPSLYWLRGSSAHPDAAIVASEPLFDADWERCPENSTLGVGTDGAVSIRSLQA
jgi:glutamine amidotransferase